VAVSLPAADSLPAEDEETAPSRGKRARRLPNNRLFLPFSLKNRLFGANIR
jgi:hypothetical protein